MNHDEVKARIVEIIHHGNAEMWTIDKFADVISAGWIAARDHARTEGFQQGVEQASGDC